MDRTGGQVVLQLPFFSDFFLRILLEFGIFPKKGEFFLKKNSMGMGFHCRQNGWRWGGEYWGGGQAAVQARPLARVGATGTPSATREAVRSSVGRLPTRAVTENAKGVGGRRAGKGQRGRGPSSTTQKKSFKLFACRIHKKSTTKFTCQQCNLCGKK